MQTIIMAVPERRIMARELRARTGGEVLWDIAHKGSWASLRRCLLAMQEDALILQDDVVPCENYQAIVQQALSLFPGKQIMFWGLYPAWVSACKRKSCSFVQRPIGGTGQAQFIPINHARAFIMWADEHIRPTVRNSDLRLDIWRTINDIPALYTCPELFTHIGKESSLHTGNNKLPGIFFNTDPNLILTPDVHIVRDNVSKIALAFLMKNSSPKIVAQFMTSFEKLKGRL